MGNENELSEIADIEEVYDDEGNDITDYRAIALERHELAKKNYGMAKRYQTKLGKQKDEGEIKTKEGEINKSNELGYGEKAFLVANGIKGKEEMTLAMEYAKQTGKPLDDIIENKFFLNELKDLRDAKSVQEAIPGGSKRAGTASRDKVEYWIAKGELPPADQVELRRAYVNAKIKKSKDSGMFYNS